MKKTIIRILRIISILILLSLFVWTIFLLELSLRNGYYFDIIAEQTQDLTRLHTAYFVIVLNFSFFALTVLCLFLKKAKTYIFPITFLITGAMISGYILFLIMEPVMSAEPFNTFKNCRQIFQLPTFLILIQSIINWFLLTNEKFYRLFVFGGKNIKGENQNEKN